MFEKEISILVENLTPEEMQIFIERLDCCTIEDFYTELVEAAKKMGDDHET